MPDTEMIDGRAIAAQVRNEVAADVAELVGEYERPPGLATILIGDDEASHVYVSGKQRACREVGIRGFDHRLPGDVGMPTVLGLIDELNGDDDVSGIICQLPVPAQLQGTTLTNAVDPLKDVDGLSVASVGRLSMGMEGLRPCTPLGVMRLLREAGIHVAGRDVTVVGRSNLFGKPMAHMLLAADATVTSCHAETHDVPGKCRRADVLICAAGVPGLVRGDWIKPGAVVIDVGITRTPIGVVGDVAFDEARGIAGHLTPVPGGVGPMTIACLMSNTIKAARLQATAMAMS